MGQTIHFPSRAWQRQALALRLVMASAEQVVPSYESAGETPSEPVMVLLRSLAGNCTALSRHIGHEREVLTKPDQERSFGRRVQALKRQVGVIWPGPVVPAPHLMHGALLVVEDVAAQAPADRRKELWTGIAASLAGLLKEKGWQGDKDIEDGAAAGEALKEVVW